MSQTTGFQLEEYHTSVHGGKLINWLRSITGLRSQHLQCPPRCWMNTEESSSTLHPDHPSAALIHRCPGSPTAHLLSYLSLPLFLTIETIGSAWDYSEKLTLVSKSNSPTTPRSSIAYELFSRVFFRGTVNTQDDSGITGGHYISRHRRPEKGTGGQVLMYDDCDNDGMAKVVPKSKISTHLAGPDDGLQPPLLPGWHTSLVVYRLQRGRAAQEEFLQHQLNILRTEYPMVQISSDALSDISHAEFSLLGDEIALVPDSQRVWYSAQSRRRREEIDYRTATPEPLPELKQPPQKRTKPHVSFAGDEVSCSLNNEHLTIALSTLDAPDDSEPPLFPKSPHSTVLPSTTVPQQREGSPHPVRCRCGGHGDGNLMIDGLDTVLCHLCETYSHIACQRNGRANHLPPGVDFECDECLGLDTNLPGVKERCAYFYSA